MKQKKQNKKNVRVAFDFGFLLIITCSIHSEYVMNITDKLLNQHRCSWKYSAGVYEDAIYKPV